MKKAIEVCPVGSSIPSLILFIVMKVHEAELVQELSIKRREAEKAEKARIAEAVANAEVYS